MFERENLPTPEQNKNLYSITLIVLSSGLHLSEAAESGTKLSWDARLRLNAVVHLTKELIQLGVVSRIVVCGGEVYSGYPPLAELMEEDIRRKLRGFMEKHKIPEEKISISRADDSLNTVEDINSGIKILESEGSPGRKSAIVISNGHHLVARLLAKKRGIGFLSAEEILGKKDRRYQAIINNIRFTPEVTKLFVTQAVGSGVLLFGGEEKYIEKSRSPLPKRAKITKFNPYGLPGKSKRPVLK